MLSDNARAMSGNLLRMLSGNIYDYAARQGGEYATLACREILSMLSDNAGRF